MSAKQRELTQPSRSTQRTSAALYDFFLYNADTIFVRVKKSPSECPDHNEYSNIRPIRLTTTCYIQEYAMTQPSGHNKHLGLLSLPTFITNITNIVTTHLPQSLLRSSKGSHTTDYRHTYKARNGAKQPQDLHNDHRGNDQVY